MTSKPPNQQNGIPPRARRASSSAGIGRHKTVAPSPLSQSTSAVHLQSHHVPSLDPSTIGVPRRLSKRRKPFQGLFGDGIQSQPQSTTSPAIDDPLTLKKQSSNATRLMDLAHHFPHSGRPGVGKMPLTHTRARIPGFAEL